MSNKEHRDLEAALMGWEDDGGAVAREPEENAVPAKPTTADRWQAIVIMLAVIGTHLVPFGGAFGWPIFAADSCSTIAVMFAFLSAFLLTVRVLFYHNNVIGKSIVKTRMPRIWTIELIGAALVLANSAPWLAVAHGMAEASIAALAVMISILASAAVSKPYTRWSLGHDFSSVAVVLVALAWSRALPHFSGTAHGEEFLGAVTIGSSSLHSWRTLIEVLAKCWARRG